MCQTGRAWQQGADLSLQRCVLVRVGQAVDATVCVGIRETVEHIICFFCRLATLLISELVITHRDEECVFGF